MLMMAGCSLSLTKTNKNFKKDVLEKNADAFIASWFEYDFAGTVKDYSDQLDAETLKLYRQSSRFQKKYGDYKKRTDIEYTITTDLATVTETVLTSSGDKIVFAVSFDEAGEVSTWKVDKYKTMGQTMATAALNTVMSMCIVFVVLIFIAIIIAQFKRVSDMEGKSAAGAAQQAAPEPAVAKKEEEAPADVSDDLELVAVIAAAIAASEGAQSADGLVVRSIIRR